MWCSSCSITRIRSASAVSIRRSPYFLPIFADLPPFAEHENPEKIVGLLNQYFSAMTEIIFAHGGTLDKYIGDGLMALFGAPTATRGRRAKRRQSRSRDAASESNRLNIELPHEGYAQIAVGIGLHTGEATVGYIGSEQRSEYTAIGDTVNLASRLESNANGGQILISEATAAASGNMLSGQHREPLTVKNRIAAGRCFEVDGAKNKVSSGQIFVGSRPCDRI